MKDRSKVYLLGFSLLGVLVLGGLFAKFIEPASIEEPSSFDLVSSLVVTPDISVYTKEAAMIVVGEVSEVVGHPNNTGIPFAGSVLDAKIDIEEILKGDPSMTDVTVIMIGNSENTWIEDGVILKQGEKVLLFLGTNGEGDYVVFAGDAGKVVIDKDGNALGAPVFTMPLVDLKAKIRAALEQSNMK